MAGPINTGNLAGIVSGLSNSITGIPNFGPSRVTTSGPAVSGVGHTPESVINLKYDLAKTPEILAGGLKLIVGDVVFLMREYQAPIKSSNREINAKELYDLNATLREGYQLVLQKVSKMKTKYGNNKKVDWITPQNGLSLQVANNGVYINETTLALDPYMPAMSLARGIQESDRTFDSNRGAVTLENFINSGKADAAQLPALKKKLALFKESEELYDIMKQTLQIESKFACYCTLEGILQTWNYLGVVATTESGPVAPLTNVSQARKNRDFPQISVTREGECQIRLRWSGVFISGRKLFLVLRRYYRDRKYYTDNNLPLPLDHRLYEWFEIVPYTSETDAPPPLHEYEYCDTSGISTFGAYLCIGHIKITEPGTNFDENAYIRACGLSENLSKENARCAKDTLSIVTIYANPHAMWQRGV